MKDKAGRDLTPVADAAQRAAQALKGADFPYLADDVPWWNAAIGPSHFYQEEFKNPALPFMTNFSGELLLLNERGQFAEMHYSVIVRGWCESHRAYTDLFTKLLTSADSRSFAEKQFERGDVNIYPYEDLESAEGCMARCIDSSRSMSSEILANWETNDNYHSYKRWSNLAEARENQNSWASGEALQLLAKQLDSLTDKVHLAERLSIQEKQDIERSRLLPLIQQRIDSNAQRARERQPLLDDSSRLLDKIVNEKQLNAFPKFMADAGLKAFSGMGIAIVVCFWLAPFFEDASGSEHALVYVFWVVPIIIALLIVVNLILGLVNWLEIEKIRSLHRQLGIKPLPRMSPLQVFGLATQNDDDGLYRLQGRGLSKQARLSKWILALIIVGLIAGLGYGLIHPNSIFHEPLEWLGSLLEKIF